MEKYDRTDDLARQFVAHRLHLLYQAAGREASERRSLRLGVAVEVSVAAAGIVADLYKQLTGRHPNEVDE